MAKTSDSPLCPYKELRPTSEDPLRLSISTSRITLQCLSCSLEEFFLRHHFHVMSESCCYHFSQSVNPAIVFIGSQIWNNQCSTGFICPQKLTPLITMNCFPKYHVTIQEQNIIHCYNGLAKKFILDFP